MFVNTNFQTWLLIGWQQSCQAIRSHVRKSLLINMDINQGVQFMRTMRTRDGGRKLIGGAEMVPLNPFH